MTVLYLIYAAIPTISHVVVFALFLSLKNTFHVALIFRGKKNSSVSAPALTESFMAWLISNLLLEIVDTPF